MNTPSGFLKAPGSIASTPLVQFVAKTADGRLGYCMSALRARSCFHKYCAFPSKLGRIFQQQGRAQLGRSFGSADTPDCAGLSLAQINSIDISTMDFSELFVDVESEARVLDEITVAEDVFSEQMQRQNEIKKVYGHDE